MDLTATNAPAGVGDSAVGPGERTVLDRQLDLGALTWGAVLAVGAVAVAAAVRLANLDLWALTPEEARRAYDAWAFQHGRPRLPGQEIPETSPLVLLLQGLGFFLFGTSDVVARLVPALLGIGIVLLVLSLRSVAGRSATLGMAALVAISPSLVFASRFATPEIVVAFLTMLLVVALTRITLPDEGAPRRWGIVAGCAAGAMLAAGPSAITVLLSLAAAAIFATALDRDNVISQGLARLAGGRDALFAAIAGVLATVLLLFTRLFSDISAIAGLGETFADWGQLLAEGSGDTPAQFFLLAVLLYELLAFILALIAVVRGRINRSGGLGWPFLGGWFAAALILWSLSSGWQPQHAVHVALPLVLLGGGVLGDLLATVDRRALVRGRGGLLLLTYLGLGVGLVAFVTLVGKIEAAVRPYDALIDKLRTQAVLEAVLVAIAVVLPLAIAAFNLIGAERAIGRWRQPVVIALVALAIPLAAFGLRSSMRLNFYTADEGTELLAQRWPTAGVKATVSGLRRLSRDTTILEGSGRDEPGGHGLIIAAERDVQWPFQWYFRDFPDFSVVETGQAHLSEAQVVLAADDDQLAGSGYTVRTVPYQNRVPGAYADPDMGDILGALFSPNDWGNGVDYLLSRDGLVTAPRIDLAVGLNGELAARVMPSTSPYSLSDRPGEGVGRGQFKLPVGVAVGSLPNNSIYVVDMGNFRVQRFDENGRFIDSWGGGENGISFTANDTIGPTGVGVGPDGLVYVADTWGHRIVVLSPEGDLIREFGAPPNADGTRAISDTTDDPAAVSTLPGFFFGPRDVVVTEEEIYVVDTGNERIQVLGIDGTFRRAFGGFGSEPGQLIEPVGIALGEDGLLYVADSGNARISVFTPNGDPVRQFPVPNWPGMSAEGFRPSNQPYLAFGADGSLYATSSTTGSVEVFSPEGEFVQSLTAIEGEPLLRPMGVAAAPDGSLLVVDNGLSAVLRYRPPVTDVVALPEGQPPAIDDGSGDEPPATAPTSEPLPRPPGQDEARG